MFTRPGNCRGAVDFHLRRHVTSDFNVILRWLLLWTSADRPWCLGADGPAVRWSTYYWLVVTGTFFIFPIYIYIIYREFHHPNWLVFFRRVETTNMNFMIFHSVGNFIIPSDVHSYIFQRGWLKPPTRLRNHDFPIAIGYPLVNSHITMENHIN